MTVLLKSIAVIALFWRWAACFYIWLALSLLEMTY